MRDSRLFRPSQLPVVQHHTRPRAGPLAMVATACAVGLIVVIVLYGMTHGPEQQQSASAPVAATSAPETTGQSNSGRSTAEQSQTPQGAPAGGESGGATTGGSNAQPAPQAQEKQPAPSGPAR